MPVLSQQDVVKKFLERGLLPTPEDVEAARTNPKFFEEPFGDAQTQLDFRVLLDYKPKQSTRKIDDFLNMYSSRYEFLRTEIAKKMDAGALVSIKNTSTNAASVSVIGMVRSTPLVLEDNTGSIPLITTVPLMEDETVGIVGRITKDGLVADQIIFPDVPLNHTSRLTPAPVRCVISSSARVIGDVLVYTGNEPPKFDGPVIWPDSKDGGNPILAEIAGVRILVFRGEPLEKLSARLGETEPVKILIRLLRARHLEPFVYRENDPLLLKEIPDVICMDLGVDITFNYKGITIVSPSKNAYVMDLSTREITTS